MYVRPLLILLCKGPTLLTSYRLCVLLLLLVHVPPRWFDAALLLGIHTLFTCALPCRGFVNNRWLALSFDPADSM